LVDGIDGSPGAKRKLKLVLETLSGKKGVAEACDELGIGEAAFYKSRSRWLKGAVDLLEPRTLGRPAKEGEVVDAEELRRLREENEALRWALRVQTVREEIAVAMPGLLDRARKGEKKTR
jgi:transposase-like protein